MDHPTAVWLEVIGEGKQHQVSALSGAPKPIVTAQHIIFSTDFMGLPMTPSQAVQIFVKEALDCLDQVRSAFLYVQQRNPEEGESCVRLVGLDGEKSTWSWMVTDSEGVPMPEGRCLKGYPSAEKAILNALLSIEWIAEALGS